MSLNEETLKILWGSVCGRGWVFPDLPSPSSPPDDWWGWADVDPVNFFTNQDKLIRHVPDVDFIVRWKAFYG
jgi:hypothetical protein